MGDENTPTEGDLTAVAQATTAPVVAQGDVVATQPPATQPVPVPDHSVKTGMKIAGTRINKLIMEGFKSFGKRTEFVFGPDFNCVVGPNGSGKSNIIDAVCFVLGKTSAKSMRATSSANLIYNGGKTHAPAKQAEVSIVFDNTSKVFPTPEEEVKITRVVHSDGHSKYKINNKTRTRQELLDLMSLAKINPDGHNIVLQGDIVRLV
ncbi:MAG: AAA family ATPase, partial [Nanoarchaeota archaeon]